MAVTDQRPQPGDEQPQASAVQERKYNFAEIGRTGLRRTGYYVNEEFLPELVGTRGVQKYREMRDNDPVIGAILFAIDKLIRQVDWTVKPASQQPEDIEAAEFVEECMDDMSMSWQDFISEVLSMLPYGWSFFEIVYKQRIGPTQSDPRRRSKHTDRRIGWRKFAPRSQDTFSRWDFDAEGSVRGMWQIAPPEFVEVYIPIQKALLFRTESFKGSPEGRSVLRNAYRPWYFKRRIEEIEAIGIERDMAGLPVAYVNPDILRSDASAEDRALFESIKDLVINVRRDQSEGVIFPNVYDEHGNKIYEFQLLNSGGNRQFDTNTIVTRYDQRIAMVVLADFILLGHEKVGSFALSSDKTDLFSVALHAWLNTIKEIINNYAIPRLFEANGFSLDSLPEIHHKDIETPDLTSLGDYITKLSGAGVQLFPDPDLEKYLREVASLPEKPEDLEEADEKLFRISVDQKLQQAESGVAGGPGMPPGGPGMPPGGGPGGGPQPFTGNDGGLYPGGFPGAGEPGPGEPGQPGPGESPTDGSEGATDWWSEPVGENTDMTQGDQERPRPTGSANQEVPSGDFAQPDGEQQYDVSQWENPADWLNRQLDGEQPAPEEDVVPKRKQLVRKGEHEGHPFRGNQHTGGRPGMGSGGESSSSSSKQKLKSSAVQLKWGLRANKFKTVRTWEDYPGGEPTHIGRKHDLSSEGLGTVKLMIAPKGGKSEGSDLLPIQTPAGIKPQQLGDFESPITRYNPLQGEIVSSRGPDNQPKDAAVRSFIGGELRLALDAPGVEKDTVMVENPLGARRRIAVTPEVAAELDATDVPDGPPTDAELATIRQRVRDRSFRLDDIGAQREIDRLSGEGATSSMLQAMDPRNVKILEWGTDNLPGETKEAFAQRQQIEYQLAEEYALKVRNDQWKIRAYQLSGLTADVIYGGYYNPGHEKSGQRIVEYNPETGEPEVTYSREITSYINTTIDAIVEHAVESGVPRERKVLLMAGLGGAGKSSLLAQISGRRPGMNDEQRRVLQEKTGGLDTSNAIVINPDDMKELLLGIDGPGVKHLLGEDYVPSRIVPEYSDLDLGSEVSLVHELSSVMGKRLQRRLAEEGFNVIVDGVLATEKSARKSLSYFNVGQDTPFAYKPYALLVDSSPIESMENARNRALGVTLEPVKNDSGEIVGWTRKFEPKVPADDQPGGVAEFHRFVPLTTQTSNITVEGGTLVGKPRNTWKYLKGVIQGGVAGRWDKSRPDGTWAFVQTDEAG